MCTPQTTSLSLCASISTTSLSLSIYLYLTTRAPLGMNRAIKPKRQQEVLDLPITNTKQNKNKSLQHRISFSLRERERARESERERVQARLLHSLYKHHFLRSPESKHASLLVLQEAAKMKLLQPKTVSATNRNIFVFSLKKNSSSLSLSLFTNPFQGKKKAYENRIPVSQKPDKTEKKRHCTAKGKEGGPSRSRNNNNKSDHQVSSKWSFLSFVPSKKEEETKTPNFNPHPLPPTPTPKKKLVSPLGNWVVPSFSGGGGGGLSKVRIGYLWPISLFSCVFM